MSAIFHVLAGALRTTILVEKDMNFSRRTACILLRLVSSLGGTIMRVHDKTHGLVALCYHQLKGPALVKTYAYSYIALSFYKFSQRYLQ